MNRLDKYQAKKAESEEVERILGNDPRVRCEQRPARLGGPMELYLHILVGPTGEFKSPPPNLISSDASCRVLALAIETHFATITRTAIEIIRRETESSRLQARDEAQAVLDTTQS